MGVFNSLFGKKQKKVTIADLSMGALQNEKYTLQEKQRKCDAEVNREEKRKQQLFAQGASSNASLMQRKMSASKMVEIDEKLNDQWSKFNEYGLKLRAVNRFIALKEKESVLKERGVWSTINQMPQEELENWALYNTVKDKKLVDKLTAVNRILGEPYEVEFEEQDKILDYMKVMEEAAEGRETLEEGWGKVHPKTEIEPPILS